MPNRHKRKNHPDIIHRIPRTPQRDIDVPNDPQIETLMPTPPESERRIIIGNATDHILGGFDAVEKGPETEEAPDDEEFKPDEDEVEESNHGNLQDSVVVPGLGFGDCDHVHVVVDEFHG